MKSTNKQVLVVGDRVLIRPDTGEKKSPAGLYLPPSVIEKQEVRGEGDSDAITIYADSFGRDPEFFSFYRSMEAYKKSIGESGTSMVLSPSSSFIKFFKNKNGN